jgi:hypothetical protein
LHRIDRATITRYLLIIKELIKYSLSRAGAYALGLHIDSHFGISTPRNQGAIVINTAIARQTSSEGGHCRIGQRRKVSVPARLTWRDASGTLRFASVVMRDVSDVDAFVECQVPASIPLYRLVHFQVERPARDGQELPAALREGKVLSAIYRVGPYKTSTGTPSGYALRLLVEKTQVAARRERHQLAVAN